jgi:hypothetical protein
MRSHIVLGFKLTCHHYHHHLFFHQKNIHIYIYTFLKDDHARIRLANNIDGDYINASTIVSIEILIKKEKKRKF